MSTIPQVHWYNWYILDWYNWYNWYILDWPKNRLKYEENLRLLDQKVIVLPKLGVGRMGQARKVVIVVDMLRVCLRELNIKLFFDAYRQRLLGLHLTLGQFSCLFWNTWRASSSAGLLLWRRRVFLDAWHDLAEVGLSG